MKKDIGKLTSEIYDLLNGLDKEESTRVLASVSTLLSLGTLPSNDNGSPGNLSGKPLGSGGQPKEAKTYFDHKKPQTKGEEFAVAARFRSENGLGDSHTKDDFKTIIKAQAKRAFDEGNFNRDIDNAIRAGKFFIKGDGKGQYMLSSIGEKYVDSLPDRDAAKAARKAKGNGAKKSKKKAAKKSTKK